MVLAAAVASVVDSQSVLELPQPCMKIISGRVPVGVAVGMVTSVSSGVPSKLRIRPVQTMKGWPPPGETVGPAVMPPGHPEVVSGARPLSGTAAAWAVAGEPSGDSGRAAKARAASSGRRRAFLITSTTSANRQNLRVRRPRRLRRPPAVAAYHLVMARDAVAEIKARLDIVDVVGGYVTLQRAGRGHRALCPFHSEKTPSFNVSQDRQAWYCFGCQEGGDMFTFVEKVEHTDFRQALELLAEKAGVELEAAAQSPERRGAARRRKRTLELNSRAAAFFEHVLWSSPAGADGRALLADRLVEESAARQFGVGFAPAGGAAEDALSRYLKEKAGATSEEIVDAGLAHHARGGRLRDRFRHRLVFPIRDERGETLAFGARALGDDVPKYLNSPETSVYHKGSALFGIDLARAAMHDRRVAVIVEGYFDVMAAHLGGVANTVASSGTALTREQAKVLSRHADSVVLCFDADDAGRAATSRAVDVVAAEGLPARICVLPDGCKDPDELVRRDPQAFAAAIDEAPPEWQVLLDRALGDDEGGSIDARRSAAERAVALLARIPEAAARELYMQQAARRLTLTAATLGSDVAAAL